MHANPLKIHMQLFIILALPFSSSKKNHIKKHSQPHPSPLFIFITKDMVNYMLKALLSMIKTISENFDLLGTELAMAKRYSQGPSFAAGGWPPLL